MKTLRIYISGTVQGVFFRRFVKQEADKLSLKGFVRNMDNGRVEVVIEGRDENVNEMLARCRKGSPHSEVRDIETHELKHQGFEEFKITSF